jgi:hypothetical protein
VQSKLQDLGITASCPNCRYNRGAYQNSRKESIGFYSNSHDSGLSFNLPASGGCVKFKYSNTCCGSVTASVAGVQVDEIVIASGTTPAAIPRIAYATFNGGEEFKLWEKSGTAVLHYVYTSAEACPSETDDYQSERVKFNTCMQAKETSLVPVCGQASDNDDHQFSVNGFNFFRYGYLTGYSVNTGAETLEQCLSKCNDQTTPCEGFTYLPGHKYCNLYFVEGQEDAMEKLTTTSWSDDDTLYLGYNVFSWVRCGRGYPQRVGINQWETSSTARRQLSE